MKATPQMFDGTVLWCRSKPYRLSDAELLRVWFRARSRLWFTRKRSTSPQRGSED